MPLRNFIICDYLSPKQEQSSKPCRLSKPPADQLEPIRGHTPKPEDILPKILPPQVFEQKGQLWLQKVTPNVLTMSYEIHTMNSIH